jgi:hypothetical protein
MGSVSEPVGCGSQENIHTGERNPEECRRHLISWYQISFKKYMKK